MAIIYVEMASRRYQNLHINELFYIASSYENIYPVKM